MQNMRVWFTDMNCRRRCSRIWCACVGITLASWQTTVLLVAL